MEKYILSSVLTLSLIIGISEINNIASAHCLTDSNCVTVFEKPLPPEIEPTEIKHPPLLNPSEHAKYKAEFEKRLNLSDKQRKEIKILKEKEAKKLEPYHKKIQKHEEALGKLFKEEHDIRKDTLDKFNKVLTQEQKNEIEKIKQETLEKLKEYAPPREMFRTPVPVNFEQKTIQQAPVQNVNDDKEEVINDNNKQSEILNEVQDKTIVDTDKSQITIEIKNREEAQNLPTQQVQNSEDIVKTTKDEVKPDNTEKSIQEIKSQIQMPIPKHERLQLPDRGELPVHNLEAPSFDKTPIIQNEIKLENKLLP